MCRYFKNGQCDKGIRCGFLHDANDQKTKYKTQICTKFIEGHCRYG